MPNWVCSSMSLRETKKGALKDFLNGTLKMDGYDAKVKSGQDWLERMKNNTLCDNYRGIWFSSVAKMPEIYDLYDTTNYPNGEKLVLGQTVKVGNQDVVVTEKVIQDFKDATLEQKQKYGIVGWYKWNCLNYGCQYDTCMSEKADVVIDNGMEVMNLDFETPWTAPNLLFELICHNFPDLDLSVCVEEELGNFCGNYNTVEDENGRYLTWTETSLENLFNIDY